MAFDEILKWTEHAQFLLFTINLFFTVFIIILTFSLKNQLKKYRFLIKDNDNKDLEQVLIGLSEKMNTYDLKVKQIVSDFSQFKEQSKFDLKKWALVRFKAFNNIGGDQSFALALMDSFGDGLVISSIFGREESIVYCKPIKNGASTYPLSKEEQEAINQALNNKKEQSRDE